MIKGTSTAEDMLTNLDVSLVSLEGTGWIVHGGFAKVAAGVLDELRPLLDAQAKVTISGHSLGGAVATIIGLVLAAEGDGPELDSALARVPSLARDARGRRRRPSLPFVGLRLRVPAYRLRRDVARPGPG